MSSPTNCADTRSAISSQASAVGPMPSSLQAGALGPYGPVPALASLSARQVKALGLQTSGISGPLGSISSSSADLQKSLESRFQENGFIPGSTLYTLTWKTWTTPSGVSRFRLRAGTLRISGKGHIGALPTPTARDFRGPIGMENLRRRQLHSRGVNLQEFMQRVVGRPGYLNPELVRLLMGYPEGWANCAPTGTRSSRKSQRRSSPPTCKPENLFKEKA